MDKFTFVDFLHILLGTIGTASVGILLWLLKDYFKFKFDYAREALTREKWEKLCSQYRNTCDARLCRKLDSLVKTMDGCSTELSDLTKELGILQTKTDLQTDKSKEVDELKIKFVRLETEFGNHKREVGHVKEKNT